MSEENKTLIYAELLSGTVGGYVTDYSQIKNAPDQKVNTINELTGLILPNPNDSNISHAVAKAYDSLNNSIFIESHAKATYMSDGSTVEDAINNIKANGGGGGNIDLSDYETKVESQNKLQESKDYTDVKTDELRDVVTQTLSLRAGNNWCSFYVDITLEQLLQALGVNATSIITSFDGSTEITSSYDATTNTWSGDLTTLDVTKMYIINVNTDCEISLTGRKIPNSTVYILNPGWNWIGYPLNQEVDINIALKGLVATEGDKIKFRGNTYAEYFDGEWFPEDFIFKPGQGYMYNNKSGETKTLVFTTELIDTKSELNKKQDILVSGTNIKTVNNKSLLGNGDLEIQEFKTYTFDYDGNYVEKTITQEELNKVLEADKIYIKQDDILVEVTVKNESDNNITLRGYNNSLNYVCEYYINIDKINFNYFISQDIVNLLTDSNIEDLVNAINYNEVIYPNIEDGLVLEEQSLTFDPYKITILKVGIESNESFKIFYLYSNALDGNSSTIAFYGKYTDTSLLKATYNVNNYTLTFNIIEQSGGSTGGSTDLSNYYTKEEANAAFDAVGSAATAKSEAIKAINQSIGSKQDTITDLEIIRQGAAKGATALQSYTEQYKGTVTGVKINGTTKNPSSGIVDLGNVITSHQDISGKQDKLVSGTNIKTINGNSILGSGNITIESSSSNNTKTPIVRITVNNGDCYIDVDTKTYITCEGNANIFLKLYEDDEYVHSYEIVLLMGESTYFISFPNNIKWIKPLTITENTRYNIIIEDNIATWVSIQN